MTVQRSDGTLVSFHTDYLTPLGGKDWGVPQKEKFMAEFYKKKLAEAGSDNRGRPSGRQKIAWLGARTQHYRQRQPAGYRDDVPTQRFSNGTDFNTPLH